MISWVILTWNGLVDTKNLVNSIINHCRQDFEIVFVDNKSTDDTPIFLESLRKNHNKYSPFFKDVVIVTDKDNMGFSKAVNKGIEIAKDRYPIVCNNDILITHNLHNVLKNSLTGHGLVLVVPATNFCGQPIQGLPDETYCAGVTLPAPDVNFVCFCIDRDFWKDNKLDEGYVSGVEDVDYCWTIKSKGACFGVTYAAFVYHKGCQTNNREFKKEGISKNLREGWIRFANKWGVEGSKRASEYFKGDEDDGKKE